ncbi:MAG: fibronectin type III domain-containing protein [Spirochaetaceae bacterium]|jgi:hypothetical protein|nr:fibronectin type III domain-containing protein [Spirochaetaceae bacterium]
MRKKLLTALLCAVLSALAFAEGEKTVMLGAGAGWGRVSRMDGVDVRTGLRPQAVLMTANTREMAAAVSASSATLDLALPFDEMDTRRYRDAARHYSVNASAGVYPAPIRWAHSGSGAAVFDKNGGAFITVKSASPDALLADNNRIGSFTIEFFLFPRVVETNAEIFLWNAALSGGKNQFVRASVVRNKISLIFYEFFASADNTRTVSLRLSSNKTLVPEKYSHHLIRFDRDTGLIEYVVDGVLEDARYTTENGREGGASLSRSNEIFEPWTGKQGKLVIGKGFNGIIDEFNLYAGFMDTGTRAIETARYPSKPGWIESETLDLGSPGASLLHILATGGYARTGEGGYGKEESNRYRGGLGGQNVSWSRSLDEAETFPDSSAIQFFVRAQETPFGWEENEWRAVKPGADLDVKGRYAQLAAALYPSADRSGAPYLASLSLVYKAVPPPAPPEKITVKAGDGFVELQWKRNPQPDADGYLVYRGTRSGEYWELPPLDAGNAASLRIDGLENGVLYYFAILTYTDKAKDSNDGRVTGIFSKEVRARPLVEARRPAG